MEKSRKRKIKSEMERKRGNKKTDKKRKDLKTEVVGQDINKGGQKVTAVTSNGHYK